MTPEDRYEALAAAPTATVVAIADAILATGAEVEILVAPETVTLPIRLPIPGTRTSTAVIGHVAMTRCAIALDGVRGDSMRPGRDLHGAVAAAVLDAEADRDGPARDEIERVAREAIAARAAAARERAQRVALTRLEAAG